MVAYGTSWGDIIDKLSHVMDQINFIALQGEELLKHVSAR